MYKIPLYRKIALTLFALEGCKGSDNPVYRNAEEKHKETLDALTDELPHGSGIDGKNEIDEKSTSKRIIINTSYHHMNETGYYDGWTEHSIIITPSLKGSFDLRVTGKDRNNIKSYLAEIFESALEEEIAY